jgi:hypothetical protein
MNTLNKTGKVHRNYKGALYTTTQAGSVALHHSYLKGKTNATIVSKVIVMMLSEVTVVSQ